MSKYPSRSLASLYFHQVDSLILDTSILEGFHEERGDSPFPNMVVYIEIASNLNSAPSFRVVRITTGTAEELSYVLSRRLPPPERFSLISQTFSTRHGEREEFLTLEVQIARIREAEEMWLILQGSGVNEFVQHRLLITDAVANINTEWIKDALDKLMLLRAVFFPFEDYHCFIDSLYADFRTLFLDVGRVDIRDHVPLFRDRKAISGEEMEGLREFLRNFKSSLAENTPADE